MAVECTIQNNRIVGVWSLNSTGQILPLALGVVTLLSVLYMWVKKFFEKPVSVRRTYCISHTHV